METIKLSNMTDLTQIIEIKPLECKVFKFPYLTTVSSIMIMLFVFYMFHRKLFVISNIINYIMLIIVFFF